MGTRMKISSMMMLTMAVRMQTKKGKKLLQLRRRSGC
jgi:hypothetical protein